MTKHIFSGNGKRAVCIYANEDKGPFEARLYVNCHPTFRTLGDATLQTKRSKNLQTIKFWAHSVLAQ